MSAPRNVDVSEDLDIPAKFLWDTLSAFEHIDRWSDLKVRSIEGVGVGARRTVEMASGAVVSERLLLCDSENMIFSYEAVQPNPYPMLDYRSTVVIEELAPQRSRLRWSGQYTPTEGSDPTRTDNLLRKVYEGGIELLRRHFDRQLSGST